MTEYNCGKCQTRFDDVKSYHNHICSEIAYPVKNTTMQCPYCGGGIITKIYWENWNVDGSRIARIGTELWYRVSCSTCTQDFIAIHSALNTPEELAKVVR